MAPKWAKPSHLDTYAGPFRPSVRPVGGGVRMDEWTDGHTDGCMVLYMCQDEKASPPLGLMPKKGFRSLGGSSRLLRALKTAKNATLVVKTYVPHIFWTKMEWN